MVVLPVWEFIILKKILNCSSLVYELTTYKPSTLRTFQSLFKSPSTDKMLTCLPSFTGYRLRGLSPVIWFVNVVLWFELHVLFQIVRDAKISHAICVWITAACDFCFLYLNVATEVLRLCSGSFEDFNILYISNWVYMSSNSPYW